jgi:hypothetical protein
VSYREDAEDFRLPKRLAWRRPQRISLADVAVTNNKMLYRVYPSKGNCARPSGSMG